jgi:GT2 family glycosyltransferase
MFVTALVCTRARPESLVRAVRSLLASEGVELEILVIDQNDGDLARDALAGFKHDPRLRLVPSLKAGKGAGLNQGIELARSEIVVCTDDDCEVPKDWAASFSAALAREPRAAVAFGPVCALPYDATAGYVPTYEPQRDRRLDSVTSLLGNHGLGAAMAVRREFILQMGGVDQQVGPGGRFPSGDDWDISVRALLLGRDVLELSSVPKVVHHGFRSFSEGREHARRDWLAIGAVCAKPIRAGHLSSAILPLWKFTFSALAPPLLEALQLRRPQGLTRITSFIQGFAQGLLTPVDSEHILFREVVGEAAAGKPGPEKPPEPKPASSDPT